LLLRVQQADNDHQAASHHITTTRDQSTSRLLDTKI
jgi:hypothetical protein